MAARLAERYQQEIVPELVKRFGYGNLMAVPRLTKIVVDMGVGAATENKERLDKAAAELALIVGQKPQITKARKSVAAFKVREGQPIGCKVTLRRERMYEFLDRLVGGALPRVRDFRGLSSRSFDGRGNYTFGVTEQIVFPEVNVDKVETPQGMHITLCISGESDEESRELLRLFGMPFAN